MNNRVVVNYKLGEVEFHTPQERETFIEHIDLCRPIQAFTCNGVIFNGNYVDSLKAYMRLRKKPSFFDFLCSTHEKLTKIKIKEFNVLNDY